jgi:hypothetical protein
MRSVKEFEDRLIDRLHVSALPTDLVNEGDLERRFLLPIVRELLQESSGIHVCAHPWKHTEKCEPTCEKGAGLIEQPKRHGCPECWKQSKKWAAARLYGLHCFDLVVGIPGDSFALEAKLLRRSGRGNRLANDGFQRLIGQCLLARFVHPRVVGLCVAEKGALDLSATSHLEAVRSQGITVVTKTLDQQS